LQGKKSKIKGQSLKVIKKGERIRGHPRSGVLCCPYFISVIANKIIFGQ
jgi:hypothetical protein